MRICISPEAALSPDFVTDGNSSVVGSGMVDHLRVGEDVTSEGCASGTGAASPKRRLAMTAVVREPPAIVVSSGRVVAVKGSITC